MPRNDLDKALHRAAYEGDLPKVQALLKAGANPNAKGEEGQNALQAAIAWFQPRSDYFTRVPTKPPVLAALLDAGAELNAQDPKGQTALILACRNGNTAAAQLLLERGANARLTDQYGWSALTWHLWKHQWYLKKNDALVALLRDHGCALTLWDALYLEDDPLAQRLVKTANARIREQ